MKTKDLSDLKSLAKALKKEELQKKKVKKDTPPKRTVLPDGSNATIEDYLSAGEPSLWDKYSDSPIPRKPNRKGDGTLTVDLHADKIQIPRGTPKNKYLEFQIAHFNSIMEANESHKGKKILFIHGVGEGSLRSALVRELDQRWWTCSYKSAGFGEMGMESALLVTIK